MIILCSYCKPPKVMGYKCGRCGSHVRVREELNYTFCTTCLYIEMIETSGTTHGICPEHEKELRESVNQQGGIER